MVSKKAALVIVVLLIASAILLLERQKTRYSREGIEIEELSVIPQEEAGEAEQQQNITLPDMPEKPKEMIRKLTQEDIERINQKKGIYKPAIELVMPDGYINTDNFTLAELIGKKVILIDFWTYSCINCQRTFPYLTSWYERYKDDGFVIVGVHTPEFSFEKDYDNVVRATKKFGIEYPVVQDNNYYTWRAYQNRYWPRKYIIDIDGFIVFDHIGEGAYEITEMKIQELLEERSKILGVEHSEFPEVEGASDITLIIKSLSKTPELYSGYDFALPRGQDIGNPGGLQAGKVADYSLPDKIEKDIIYLDGKWLSNSDNLQAQGSVSIILNFIARSVNIVADTLGEPVKVDVFIDDDYITREQAGRDVQFDGEKAFILVDHAGLYNVFAGRNDRYILKLSADSKELYFNSFTFG